MSENLPDVGEPLVLADGTVIRPSDGSVDMSGNADDVVEVPRASEAQQLVVRTRKKIADLPEVPAKMNVVGVVFMYATLGMDDSEIAVATGLTEHNVASIKMSDIYTDIAKELQDNILQADADDIRSIVHAGAKEGAKKMLSFASQEQDKWLALSAARDLLDRDGHRAKDVVEHRHKMEGGLVIEVVEKKHTELPVIDIDAKEITDGTGN